MRRWRIGATNTWLYGRGSIQGLLSHGITSRAKKNKLQDVLTRQKGSKLPSLWFKRIEIRQFDKKLLLWQLFAYLLSRRGGLRSEREDEEWNTTFTFCAADERLHTPVILPHLQNRKHSKQLALYKGVKLTQPQIHHLHGSRTDIRIIFYITLGKKTNICTCRGTTQTGVCVWRLNELDGLN